MTATDPTTALQEFLTGLEEGTLERAIALARHLQTRAAALQTREEKRQQAELERMLQSADDRATLTQMTDQAFRAKSPRRAAEQLTHILDVQGVPRFFGPVDRAMLKGFQSFGDYLPGVSMPLVKGKLRGETANVILPAEVEHLSEHLEHRRAHGIRMNVNFLGEALLGEDEARRRLESYLAALQLPVIEVISVKVSTLYSQLAPISRRHAVEILCDRMELLYRAAAEARFTRSDGTEVPKFVYLDMEEYRDLEVTVETFIETLSRPGLENVGAGIALQAYLPDAFVAQRRIDAWARRRVAAGGAPVTIRLVKGANMEAERVAASIAGWPQATYTDKLDTDANYKRMLHEAVRPENLAAVRIGVASHNLFEVAYALVLAVERGALEAMQFEMLEGMANHQRRALSEFAENLLLYAPATRREDFVNAIGYLIRRMDENTGSDNFLRHAFKLQVGTPEWENLERGFRASFAGVDTVSAEPRRTQDRGAPLPAIGPGTVSLEDFANEPDTDFALPQNLAWAEGIVARARDLHGQAAAEIPLFIAGEEFRGGREVRECRDPSRPGVVVGRYRQATSDDVDRALACARADPTGWRDLEPAARGELLAKVGHELRRGRGDLMAAALADGGKLLTESDPEVSEAIDFALFYAASVRALHALAGVVAGPKGVGVVVSPWNFPIAIPCGGVSAALAAGNTVILKPASHTVLVAHELCQCFWRAGVPREVLQLVPCAGATGGARLVSSPDVGAVILTGGTDTALRMLEAKPDMQLLAETGGKNGTIVTAMSDREQAIAHVLHSAFSHSGQKCSATSLLVLEAEVFDDPSFEQTLCDAVRSIRVGSAWNLDTRMGPLIAPPSGDLERGLSELEDSERWAVLPERRENNPCLWSPGVKWGVQPRSYTHRTEFFGPVLAVMRADDLDHAIEIVNQTGYGLTAGLESLDEREREVWQERVRAGNLYANRATTGAIVLRQPFGGVGKSAFGPGIKAGGPNYVAQLMTFEDVADVAAVEAEVTDPALAGLRDALRAGPSASPHGPGTFAGFGPGETERICAAIASYTAHNAQEFAVVHDPQRLVGQDNFRRYRPVPALRVRVHPDDNAFEIFARVAAARSVGCRVTVSTPPNLDAKAVASLDALTEPWAAAIEFVEESDAELAEVVRARQTDRLRYARAERVPLDVRRAIGDSGIYVADAPVSSEGRIELLWYVTEQSVSIDYHRYGNLGARSDERRKPVQ
jgi:RHH-type proline utilization regulon transcriptional repressor/proline dehydrogenase/delta 1-pyrroline-5-carboxylate dehydrogenase